MRGQRKGMAALLALTATALLLGGAGQANAAPIFSFSYSGPGVTATGTLNATDNNDGSFTVTSGSGTRNSQSITIIPNPNAPAVDFYLGNGTYDNQIFPNSSPQLDAFGLLFSAPGGEFVNVFFSGGFFEFSGTSNLNTWSTVPLDFALVSIPEPSSVALFGLGALALAGRRRQEKNAKA